ncbi:unnamed protein product [Rotaria magnacalcarata]|uniref:Major facilitator superfamily (MFS) profile domain-containing protein n=1 Tax=Rotaria magnacalcarata TaxID=392030 RepID=A0A815MKK6_9BILA|nr:unnamed protein product [Rotaria magnacalcarata]
MSTAPAISRLHSGDGTDDSTQRGCTSWLLISCIILTITTSFVFGWGLAAPNMYNDFTEPFLKGKDSCSVDIRAHPLSNETVVVPAIVADNNAAADGTNGGNSEKKMNENGDAAVDEKSDGQPKKNEAFNFIAELVKGIPQTIFLIGAFIGAITGPSWFLSTIYSVLRPLCVLLGSGFQKPWLFYLSRLLLGYQGGMACAVVPPFINEISSQRVRGTAGAGFQLSLTIGILVAQIVGLPFIAGTCERWGWGLSIVFLLPLVGVFVLFLIPNSPTQMIGTYNNEEQAIIDLKKLRGTNNVQADLELIREQTRQTGGGKTESLSIPQVLTSAHYRWPMLTTVVLQFAQALSGVNAVFFYSSKMFEKAGIPKGYIPYANIGTGAINVLATIVSLFLIEKLGRKKLVIYPMIVMIFVFGVLTALVEYNESRNNAVLGFISVIFILLFIVCFAVGLGPIPFLYGSEVCRPEARDSVQSLGLIANYIGNILLSLFFPMLNSMLGGYVFLIFVLFVAAHVAFLWFKMPETKNKSIEYAEQFWKIPVKNPNEKLLPATANA